MSDKTKGMTEAELADYYDQTHDVSEFDEDGAYPTEVRRNVTISVRFSEEEIARLRAQADALGMKVTQLIRSAALEDRESVLRALKQLEKQTQQLGSLIRH
ncbi:MAG TPA: CopG family antitoxin [Nocardioidaceae bacterium]|nr:CopG family antitoxin [Nocardioidaceae bacterium]